MNYQGVLEGASMSSGQEDTSALKVWSFGIAALRRITGTERPLVPTATAASFNLDIDLPGKSHNGGMRLSLEQDDTIKSPPWTEGILGLKSLWHIAAPRVHSETPAKFRQLPGGIEIIVRSDSIQAAEFNIKRAYTIKKNALRQMCMYFAVDLTNLLGKETPIGIGAEYNYWIDGDGAFPGAPAISPSPICFCEGTLSLCVSVVGEERGKVINHLEKEKLVIDTNQTPQKEVPNEKRA